MTIAFAILAAVFLGLFIAAFLKVKRLEKAVAAHDAEVAAKQEVMMALATRDNEIAVMQEESERVRKHYESESLRIYTETKSMMANIQQECDERLLKTKSETQAAVVAVQGLADQQFLDLKQESERIRQHYESEARKAQEAAEVLLAKTLKELEPLKKYETLRTTEAEIQKLLTDAISQASALRQEAQTLLEQSRTAASEEKSAASKKAKEIREQADAILNQATQEAGRIIEDANKSAEKIGGDAYIALRDKETLEQAVGALWNTVDGYGDRYVIPTRSLLDDCRSSGNSIRNGKSC